MKIEKIDRSKWRQLDPDEIIEDGDMLAFSDDSMPTLVSHQEIGKRADSWEGILLVFRNKFSTFPSGKLHDPVWRAAWGWPD